MRYFGFNRFLPKFQFMSLTIIVDKHKWLNIDDIRIDVIWGSLCKTKLAALQRLQSRAWLIIENAKIKDLWSSSWLNVEIIIRYDRNVMTHKIVNRLCPENLLINTCPDHVFLHTIREILRIFKSLDAGQSFSKRVFTMHR